jgi:hypothetical protein
MGRTLPSATVVLMQEEAAFARFRRALRRSDQLALDDLFVAARQHIAAVQFASHALPFEVYLLSMLLEEHKEVMKLRDQFAALALGELQDGMVGKAGGPSSGESIPDGKYAPEDGQISSLEGIRDGEDGGACDKSLASAEHILPRVEVHLENQAKNRAVRNCGGASRQAACRAWYPFVDPGFGSDDTAGLEGKSLPD